MRQLFVVHPGPSTPPVRVRATTNGREFLMSTTAPFHPLPAGHRAGGATVPLARLSPREREVLAFLAHRFTDLEIAEALSISRRTASHHVASILAKLGVANRRQAGALAIHHGLV